MDGPVVYAIVVGGCITAFGLRKFLIWFSRIHGPSLSAFVYKRFIYYYSFPRVRLFGPVSVGPVSVGPVSVGPFSRMQVLLQITYYVGSAVCNILGVKNLNQASSRAGILAVFNLIPLTLGDRLTFTASMLGVPSRVARRFHSTMGWMATFQGLVHVILSIKQHPFELKLVGVCMLALSLFSLAFVRRASYEVFLQSHYIFGIVALIGLWRHLGPRLSPARVFLIVSVGLLASTKAVRWLSIIYRNILVGKPWPKGKFFPTGGTDGVELRIRVARPWTPRANQYLHVCVPGISPWSFTESHPYCVAWWENDAKGRLDTVSLLIKPYQGFSSRVQRVSRHMDWTAVAIDGPYGTPLRIAAFGTMVVFASGIGIAAQIPLIKQALEERASDRTPLRRILLVWVIEESSEMDWVKVWMQRILDMDLQSTRQRYGYQELENVNVKELENWEEDKLIFRSEVYALHSPGNDAPLGRRTTLFRGKLPDVAAIVKREYNDRLGKILVTVCAEQGTRDRVRGAATKLIGPDMKYEEMDFQPVQDQGLWRLKCARTEAGSPGSCVPNLSADAVELSRIEKGVLDTRSRDPN